MAGKPKAANPEGSKAKESNEDDSRYEFYRVPRDIYRANDQVETDLYFYYQRQHLLFKSKGSVWNDSDFQKLLNSDVDCLFIKFKSPKHHHEFLQDKLRTILSRPQVPIERKARVLYEIADPIISTAFKTPGSTELIQNAGEYAKSCIQFLNSKGSLPELIKLSSESFTEHSHGLHVSVYSVALAKKMGFQEHGQLFALGMGALLHDIGKSKIEATILNKPGELDDREWQLMRQHPEFGEQILKQHDFVPALSKKIVAEHHERINGKGYPKGIKGIHMFSKIVGIADCFNTLISDRAYAKPMPPYDALRFMVQTMKPEFDPSILEQFILMLSD
ncbi:MAG: HD domain-containing protein [Deltaproteobacteria bacterium]|nr:HD domain-containing protein [Deltaproteobacteria bacterium]